MPDTSHPDQLESRWQAFSGDQFQRLYHLAQEITTALTGLEDFGQLTLDEFVDLATVEASRRSGVWPQPAVEND